MWKKLILYEETKRAKIGPVDMEILSPIMNLAGITWKIIRNMRRWRKFKPGDEVDG
jgi:hypothetical protein